MAGDKEPLKADNDVRRLFFSANLHQLTSRVLRLNRIDAASALGVDYGWLRKACTIGLSRADKRSVIALKKIAEHFRIPVEELWTPNLLVQIWAGGYLPEVRAHFVRKFHFNEFAAKSKGFQEEIEDSRDLGTVVPQADLPKTPPRSRRSARKDERVQRPTEQLEALLATGKFEYLRCLIHDLFMAENSAKPKRKTRQ